MDGRITWMRPLNNRVPCLYDVAILQVLADEGGFLNPFVVHSRVAKYGASGAGNGHNMTDLVRKGLVSEQRVEGDPYSHVGITPGGQEVLELCKKTSLIFTEIEASFEKVGW